MFGLILTTQIVSYPLFIKVKSSNFSDYHSDYVNRISLIVIPVMLSEFFLAVLLFLVIQIEGKNSPLLLESHDK